MNRYRQLRDSQSIFEVCIIGMMIVIVLTVLFSFAADAIDKTLANNEAALDRHLSPAKRADVVRW